VGQGAEPLEQVAVALLIRSLTLPEDVSLAVDVDPVDLN
jgi:hypothetical protein